MANSLYAKEWLTFAKRNLETARLLYEAHHYEDIIGIELQQSLEKTFKSLLAYQNRRIPKTHKLLEIIVEIPEVELTEEEIFLLERATNYYRVDRYPHPGYSLPSREEIKTLLEFTEALFDAVCKRLSVTP